MGEPIFSGILCLVMAFGMMGWNWHVVEEQKKDLKRQAECAKASDELARAKLEVGVEECSISNITTSASDSVSFNSESAERSPVISLKLSSEYEEQSCVKVQKSRDRAQTSPPSPPSSPAPLDSSMLSFRPTPLDGDSDLLLPQQSVVGSTVATH